MRNRYREIVYTIPMCKQSNKKQQNPNKNKNMSPYRHSYLPCRIMLVLSKYVPKSPNTNAMKNDNVMFI